MGHLLGSSMIRLTVTFSKRAYATHCVTQLYCTLNPCAPAAQTLLVCASAGDTQTLKVKFCQTWKGWARWQSRRMCAHLLLQELQNCNGQLNNHWQKNVGSHPIKDTLQPRVKEKPQQDGRRGEIAFRIKLYIHQRHSQGSKKTLCTRRPRDPTETEPDLSLSVWVSPAEAQTSSVCAAGAQGFRVQ